tara:strand:+ start:1096 stop:2373 length:1278 start_codon:yes stop_codon:yes gene_type:complete
MVQSILDKYRLSSNYGATPSSDYLLGSANNANPMVPKSKPQNLGLLNLSSNSNPMMGLLGNPLFAIGTALLNPRQSFGQNLQQGFQNLMQQQMYKQEQERKNRADMIQLAPLIKQQQIQEIFNKGGFTQDNIKQAQEIDPLIAEKFVSSAANAQKGAMRLSAYESGINPDVVGLKAMRDVALNSGIPIGQLAPIDSIISLLNRGLIDSTSPQVFGVMNTINQLIDSQSRRDSEQTRYARQEARDQRKEDREVRKELRGATSEQNSFMLADNALNAANNILKIVKENPDAGVPGYGAEIATGIFGDLIGRKFKSEDRNIIEDSQRQFIDAVLTLGTGAAYNEYQLEGAKVTYFPQPGDGEKARLIKQQSLINAIDAAINRTGALEPKIKPKLEKLKKLIQDSYTPKPANQPIEDKNKKLRDLLGGS